MKNCLFVLRNKKINNFDRTSDSLSAFSASGIYFDRLEYCAYDDSQEITRSLKELKGNYENTVILSPKTMEEALKSFIEKLFDAQFDTFGVLNSAEGNVFLIISDGESKLSEAAVVEIISKNCGVVYSRAYVRTVGAPASLIDLAIAKAKELCPECDFNVTDSFSDCTVEIVYPENISKQLYDGMLRGIIGKLNDYIYALDDISLAERLYQILQLRRMKISVAESFTGGGISKRLVDVPGVSEVYFEGLNTYSNESKIKRLGVDALSLRQYGAVSEETAYAMAAGLLATGDCDISVATTGIAGPKSDSTLKPVGLVYISVGTRENISVFKYQLNGSRRQITETAINLALFHAFKTLK